MLKFNYYKNEKFNLIYDNIMTLNENKIKYMIKRNVDRFIL